MVYSKSREQINIAEQCPKVSMDVKRILRKKEQKREILCTLSRYSLSAKSADDVGGKPY